MQDQQEFNIPEEVDEETSRTVQELVKYFASQRSIMNKGDSIHFLLIYVNFCNLITKININIIIFILICVIIVLLSKIIRWHKIVPSFFYCFAI